jgi:hypothetical protein
MRVRTAWIDYSTTISTPYMDPCSNEDASAYNLYYYGTTRDYVANVVPLPVCSGTPSGISASASQAFGCSTYSSILSLTGITASGFSYQWQSSPDNSAWTNTLGATNASYTATVSSSIYYRCVVTCISSSGSINTAGVNLVLSPTAPLPYTESFEGITANNTLPPCMASTNLGTITKTYTSATGSYNQAARTGTNFASFRYSSSDWFFTPGFAVVAGNTYQFSFWYVTDGLTGWTTNKIWHLANCSRNDNCYWYCSFRCDQYNICTEDRDLYRDNNRHDLHRHWLR